jgi:pSer/pThr/pTyr-binding forkhead associated (FHA) protein
MGIKLTAKHNWNQSNSQPFFERTFRQNRISIGNHVAAHLRLNGSVVAAEQLVIVDGMVEPIIINCADGTWLNGEVLAPEERRSLRDGDVIHIGTYVINVSVLRNAELENDLSELFLSDESPPATSQQLNETGQSELQVSSSPVLQDLPTSLEDSGDSLLSIDTQHSKPTKTFAAILDGLRTDEDRFYFLIEGGPQSGMRVAIENDETPLGLHLNGNHLSFDADSISTMFAVVRKDWSGVLLHPQFRGVTINGEAVDDVRRLRDGDRIAFAPKERRVDSAVDSILIFREPASLVILDSLMPRTTPPETDTSQVVQTNGHIQSSMVHSSVQKFSALFTSNTEYFGVFTFAELSLMAIGTLVGAVIIFLILNYS